MSQPVVICVDDEEIVLNSLESALKRAFGNQIILEFADNGADGLEILAEMREQKRQVALVISDYIMPGMKGDEFLCKIHQSSVETLKILLTGQADISGVVNAVNDANLYRYIGKPWEDQDLMLTVKAALEKFEQDRQLERKNRELEALNEAYRRFVPQRFLEHLGKSSVVDVELGDCVKKEMSILFSDLRSFTTFSESMSPQDNFRFLNAYLKRMEPAITKHGGVIDKYIGDAVMALYDNSPDEALHSGIEMQLAITEYNEHRANKGFSPISAGVGIHSGSMMLGVIGALGRMQSTVISDTVNAAARIEGLTKTYNARILLSDYTYQSLENLESYHARIVDRLCFKGKSQEITVWEIFDADPEPIHDAKLAMQEAFEIGVFCYFGGEFAEAKAQFQKCLARSAEDIVVQKFIERCDLALLRRA